MTSKIKGMVEKLEYVVEHQKAVINKLQAENEKLKEQVAALEVTNDRLKQKVPVGQLMEAMSDIDEARRKLGRLLSSAGKQNKAQNSN